MEKPKANPILMILFILGGLAIIAGITFLIWWLVGNSIPDDNQQNNTPIETTATPEEKPTEAPTSEPTKTPVATAKATTVPSDASSTIDKTGSNTSMGGYDYSIKQGDTLWDLAQAAYKDPWKWKIIYQANQSKIKNPNIIFIGQKLEIPEK
jgi:nucleoid-associated protein YgaU